MSRAIVARHYQSGKPSSFSIEEGRFSEIRPSDATGDLPWIAPGLIDPQINGFGGIDFNRPFTSDQWEHATSALAQNGCTHFLATLITNSPGGYDDLLESFPAAYPSGDGACLGLHFEGPFLNPDPGTRGAHDPALMASPDPSLLASWQKKSGGRVRLITLAPEVDINISTAFIRDAADRGIRISIGHSLAIGDALDAAIGAGATCWTHLGNACPPEIKKFENPLLHALSRKALLCSVIPDGIHVPPHAFAVFAAALRGRLLLTTDAMAGAGTSPGIYSLCQHDVSVGPDGVARVPDSGRLAGSTLTPIGGVFRAAGMADTSWPEMWDAASVRVARWLGFPHGLETGLPASFCLLSPGERPTLLSTWRDGLKVWGE